MLVLHISHHFQRYQFNNELNWKPDSETQTHKAG